MMVIQCALFSLLGVCLFVATATSAADTTLPDQAFWNNNNWPSDLISVEDFIHDDDDEKKILDFLPLENPKIISGQSDLNKIKGESDPEAQVLTSIYKSGSMEIEIQTWNGSWINELYLPDASDVLNLSEFQLTCDSGWGVTVHYTNGGGTTQTIYVSNGNKLILAVVEGSWITEDEYNPTPHPTMAPNDTPLLDATVLFAQSQIFPSKHRIEGDNQPHLTALRKTLVMLRPNYIVADDEKEVEIKMTIRDVDGKMISSNGNPIEMKDPSYIPKQDGWIELGNTNVEDIDFLSSLTDPYIIKGQSNLDKIKDDKEADELTEIMKNENEVEIKTSDGSWARNIYFPHGTTIPADSKIQFTCNSGYHVNVYYPNTQTGGLRTKKISKGQTIMFVLVNSIWLSQDDIGHNMYVFGHGFFTATLEEEWVQQGITLEFTAISSGEEDKIGILDEIKIGGVTELVITAIDAGFLTEPRDEFSFRNDKTSHREYFQTVPVSRLIVAQYESMYLTEIMLPTGKKYTAVSDTNGGWHDGDMRQDIGKILMSHGIDLANYGISSSKGKSEQSHPFTCALLAAHNTVGMYQNGRQVHGGSGGNGMMTLDSSIGNEMSHEAGHNYGLGHYVGKFDGSVHRPSSEINSSWGWDSAKNVFIPNFSSTDTGEQQCLENDEGEEECQLPFMEKYKYGKDSMAGGSPMWGSNRFTLYTPHVAKKIQNFLENKAVWDPTSSTGFRKFDQSLKEMKEFVNNDNGEKVPRMYRIPVTTIVGYYDPSPDRGYEDYVYPAMHGAYGFVYDDDGGPNKGTTSGCELVVETLEKTLVYTLTTQVYNPTSMNKFHVNVATEDKPNKVSIYCFDELRTSRSLDGPNQDEPPLTYSVNGIPFSSPSSPPTVCKSLSKKKCKRNKEECKHGKGNKIHVCVAKEEANKDFCKGLAKSNGKKSKKCKKSKLCRNKKVKNSCKGCHPLSCENDK